MSGILSVYNHYTTLPRTSRSYGRSDSHKRSELKDIYNSIVKMNRESPLYKFDSSNDTYHYVIDIKEDALNLNDALSSIEEDDEDFSSMNRSVFSSDPQKVAVSFNGDSSVPADIPGFEVEISQLATPQINTGHFLPDSRMHLEPGDYSFDIQTRNLRYGFQFQVSSDDTNLSLQERLAKLINKSGTGIQANIVNDPTKEYTALQLKSVATGYPKGGTDATHFGIVPSSTNNSTEAIEYFGLQHVSQHPGNSSFTIDGEEHTSASNELLISNSFEVSLKQPTTSPVTIGFKTDFDSISDTIHTVADTYNSFLYHINSYKGSQARSRILYRDISSIASRQQNSLESIGLNVKEDGRLAVDENLLNQALTEDSADTFQTVSGFKSALNNRLKDVSLNPMNYVTKTIVSYPNPGKTFANPYVTSMYSGMLFNSYC